MFDLNRKNITGTQHPFQSESVSCSVMSDSLPTPWTVAGQASLSVGFPRQEYWNGLPLPSPKATMKIIRDRRGSLKKRTVM